MRNIEIIRLNKIKASIIITILLIGSISGVWAVTRTISGTQDNIETFIRNSNGKYWSPTNANIQNAIWDLNSTDGGEVFLPSGTIDISNPIQQTNHTTISGVCNATVLRAIASMNGIIINKNQGNENIWGFTIRDLTIDGNGQTCNGIDIKTLDMATGGKYSNSKIINCYIFNCGGYGINISEGGTYTIENNIIGTWDAFSGTLGNDDYAIHIIDSNDCKILNNHISHNGAGIYNDESHTCNVVGNYIVHNDNDGIYLKNEGNNCIFGNSLIQNGGNGIVLDNHHQNTICSNLIQDNAGNYGIHVKGRHNLISGNNIYNQDIGIYIDDSKTNQITSNWFRDNDIGIELHWTYDILISSNEFYSNTNENIYYLDTAQGDNVLIDGNYIYGGTYGIRWNGGDDIQITNNRITSCTNSIDINNANVVRPFVSINNWEGCTNDPTYINAVNPLITSNVNITGGWWSVGDDPS